MYKLYGTKKWFIHFNIYKNIKNCNLLNEKSNKNSYFFKNSTFLSSNKIKLEYMFETEKSKTNHDLVENRISHNI